MTPNEIKFLDYVVNNLHYVAEAQRTIKEQYGIDSEYDKETMTLHLKSNGINESLQLASAKQYVDDNFLLGIDAVYDFR
jgi:hypothetical protein